MTKTRLSFERKLWLFLFVLFLLLVTGIFLNVKYRPAPITQVENFTGKQGVPGDIGLQGAQGVAGYTPIKGIDYTDGAPGIPGAQGIQGETGVQGIQGPRGDQGDTGNTGQDGKTPEFRCNPRNHNYEWRYVGDEDWQTLQKNSQACTSASL